MSGELTDIRALVIGLGSIGGRHARVLAELGARVEVVTRRAADAYPVHPSIEAALERAAFDYCVVSSATSEHAADVLALAEGGFHGRLLVEKPVTARSGELPPDMPFARIGVGYNVRFHPAVRWLRRQLDGQTAIVADFAAQSFLPDWRPGREYRSTASASRERGGGVLRDLSHEVDLMLSLCGEPVLIRAVGGNLGDLDVRAETAASAVLELERAAVATLRLSYLDRLPERRIRVTTGQDTLEANLLTGACRTSTSEESHPVDWNRTYADLHLEMLGSDPGAVCTFEEGMRVVACIEELEKAADIGPEVGA